MRFDLNNTPTPKNINDNDVLFRKIYIRGVANTKSNDDVMSSRCPT